MVMVFTSSTRRRFLAGSASLSAFASAAPNISAVPMLGQDAQVRNAAAPAQPASGQAGSNTGFAEASDAGPRPL